MALPTLQGAPKACRAACRNRSRKAQSWFRSQTCDDLGWGNQDLGYSDWDCFFTPCQQRVGIQYRIPRLHTADNNFNQYSSGLFLLRCFQHCPLTYSLNSDPCGYCDVVVPGTCTCRGPHQEEEEFTVIVAFLTHDSPLAFPSSFLPGSRESQT